MAVVNGREGEGMQMSSAPVPVQLKGSGQTASR
jgi:hypothetical protein